MQNGSNIRMPFWEVPQLQAAECLRLVKLAQSKHEAEVLKNISSSWTRLAGQIDRYNALVREQGRTIRK
jgi:hypothetical protein